MIGPRTEKGVLVILCLGGQNPRQKQLYGGKVYLDLWFQGVSFHRDGSQSDYGPRMMVWSTGRCGRPGSRGTAGGRQAEP